MRMMENAQHLCREIAHDRQDDPARVLDDAAMAEYLRDYTLSGALVLSTEGKILCAASQDGRTADLQVREQMEAQLAGSIVLKVADHPEQVYAGRSENEDGSYVDTAACARKDGDGVLVVYYRTTAEYVRNYNLSYQNCVQGYNPAVDGTIVVTRGDRIVASNDTSLLDTTVDDNPTLSALKARSTDGGMIHVHSTTGQQYAYGIVGQGRSFYIYVYRPEQEVYVSTMRNVSMAAFTYMVLLFLLQLLRGKTDQRYREQQLRREQEYQKTLKAAALKAESANLAKTEFLQRMSHDIRTPMNAIIGFTTLALSNIDDTDRVKDYLGKTLASSNHLLSLINDVLDMSRIESGKIHLEEVEVNLSDVLHDLKTIVSGQIYAKQLELYMDVMDVTDEDVYCDKTRLNQILLNLLSNAIKFTPAGGTVSVRVRQLAGKVHGCGQYEFRIKDNGIGMSQEFAQKIFEPFERERTSTVSRIQGTGLGMAITKNIVDMMGGTIEVQTAQGKGTEFTVCVPMRAQTEQRPVEKITELEGLKALVVDDDFNTCDSVTKMLVKWACAPSGPFPARKRCCVRGSLSR